MDAGHAGLTPGGAHSPAPAHSPLARDHAAPAARAAPTCICCTARSQRAGQLTSCHTSTDTMSPSSSTTASCSRAFCGSQASRAARRGHAGLLRRANWPECCHAACAAMQPRGVCSHAATWHGQPCSRDTCGQPPPEVQQAGCGVQQPAGSSAQAARPPHLGLQRQQDAVLQRALGQQAPRDPQLPSDCFGVQLQLQVAQPCRPAGRSMPARVGSGGQGALTGHADGGQAQLQRSGNGQWHACRQHHSQQASLTSRLRPLLHAAHVVPQLAHRPAGVGAGPAAQARPAAQLGAPPQLLRLAPAVQAHHVPSRIYWSVHSGRYPVGPHRTVHLQQRQPAAQRGGAHAASPRLQGSGGGPGSCRAAAGREAAGYPATWQILRYGCPNRRRAQRGGRGSWRASGQREQLGAHSFTCSVVTTVVLPSLPGAAPSQVAARFRRGSGGPSSAAPRHSWGAPR